MTDADLIRLLAGPTVDDGESLVALRKISDLRSDQAAAIVVQVAHELSKRSEMTARVQAQRLGTLLRRIVIDDSGIEVLVTRSHDLPPGLLNAISDALPQDHRRRLAATTQSSVDKYPIRIDRPIVQTEEHSSTAARPFAVAPRAATMISKAEIQKRFELFAGTTGGIDGWLAQAKDETVFERLGQLDKQPLSLVQLNQLLVLSHEGGVSDGYFRYYWLKAPPLHTYDVTSIPDFDKRWIDTDRIHSLDHLRWGLYRIYVDALLFFGNIRTAYRTLRYKTEQELEAFFKARRFDTKAIRDRGPALSMREIARDDRYLISEMACKSYDANPGEGGQLKAALQAAFQNAKLTTGKRIKIRDLLSGEYTKGKFGEQPQTQFLFSADEILDDDVGDLRELDAKFDRILKKFEQARIAASANTKLYLSLVRELDVYVATSMRTRKDFRSMAETCDAIFADERLKEMHLRYFDPTLSAADGHEDKGLIECLMVKCAKVLVYCAGEKESYGKDAEAAMALSLGKPVIFYCEQKRTGFYRDVHPLSRLIQFDTGVPVGAIVTDSREEVSELLYRILSNRMEYEITQPKPGYYRLKEKLTNSVVRLQTNDDLLRETFWNYYHTNLPQ